MRRGGILLLALVAGVLSGATIAVASIDRGSDRPPGRFDDDSKSIWMTEWTSCWRLPLGKMSSILHIPVKAGMSPQQAANKLARRAVYLLYETTPETVAAADGCRNGILWRYYHPPAAK
jgi:hypothetical protein